MVRIKQSNVTFQTMLIPIEDYQTFSILIFNATRKKVGLSIDCSAILALLDKDDDLRARHELLNTERIL